MGKCQEPGCEKEGIECKLYDYDFKSVLITYCTDHCKKNGFCRRCGEFWGGVAGVELDEDGLCPACKDKLKLKSQTTEEA